MYSYLTLIRVRVRNTLETAPEKTSLIEIVHFFSELTATRIVYSDPLS